ncbi:MAG: PAS domain-containing protein [Proteobacteria bacterium]|nr:PAS domain-containing protein [Pseudomonadota bacterium]
MTMPAALEPRHDGPQWLVDMPPEIEALYRYWDKKRGLRRMPRRADVDPADLTAHLPSILLVDVVPDDRLYVYRLVGTREAKIRGNDPTGKPVMDNTFLDRAQALRNYDHVVLSKAPHVDATPTTSEDREWLDMESIFLPLSEDDNEVDKILVYTVQKRAFLP